MADFNSLDEYQKWLRAVGFSPEDTQTLVGDVSQKALDAQVQRQGTQGLSDILSAQGLSPQQRAMLNAALQQNIGQQAEAAGRAFGRRAAAQGIGGTGLANAGLGNVLSGTLAAQQAGQQGLNQQGLNTYLNALQTAFGARQNQLGRDFTAEQAAKERRNQMLGSLFNTLGQGAQLIPLLF